MEIDGAGLAAMAADDGGGRPGGWPSRPHGSGASPAGSLGAVEVRIGDKGAWGREGKQSRASNASGASGRLSGRRRSGAEAPGSDGRVRYSRLGRMRSVPAGVDELWTPSGEETTDEMMGRSGRRATRGGVGRGRLGGGGGAEHRTIAKHASDGVVGVSRLGNTGRPRRGCSALDSDAISGGAVRGMLR